MSQFLGFLLLITIISSSSSFLRYANGDDKIGLRLKVTPSHSPESPLYIANLTKLERLEGMIATSQSQFRRQKFNILNSPSSSSNERLLGYRHGLYYTAELKIGSDELPQRLMIDTASSTIWTQCAPCVHCFPQKLPLYDSQKSISFVHLQCTHPLCQGYPFSCQNGRCVYSMKYGGGDVTKGVAGNETFSIQMDDGLEAHVLINTIFGCSNENQFEFHETDGMISGILGLSMGEDSLISQLGGKVDYRFSYCLVPYDEFVAKPFIIRFGTAVTRFPNYAKIIPVRTPQPMFFYFLPLMDVSVGSLRLRLPLGSFIGSPAGQEAGGIFIDSAAPFTIIDSTGLNPYWKIMKAFSDYYESRNLHRKPEKVRGLELCYYYPDGGRGVEDILLPMIFHFQGADYYVEPRYMHLILAEDGYFCVVLLPGDGFNILGAWQQQNKRIVYDVAMSRLIFYYEECSKDLAN